MFNPICNYTIQADKCTFETCCKGQGTLDYIPTLAGNIVYCAIFALIISAHLILGVRYRTWTFLVGMTFGLTSEIIGYAGRIWMHYSIFTMNPFLIYLICLTIGPAFLSASIYLCLSRIVHIYGAGLSRIKPKLYTRMFVCCDLLSLILQGAGGGIAATAPYGDTSQVNLGTDIMVAGLAFQVFSLLLFMALCAEFALRVRKAGEQRTDEGWRALRETWIFKGFLFALGASTIFIFIRSTYRVIELQGGFGGALANNEIDFMILEGPMIMIATIVLVVFHPGFCLGGHWANIDKPAGKQAAEERYDEYKLVANVRETDDGEGSLNKVSTL